MSPAMSGAASDSDWIESADSSPDEADDRSMGVIRDNRNLGVARRRSSSRGTSENTSPTEIAEHKAARKNGTGESGSVAGGSQSRMMENGQRESKRRAAGATSKRTGKRKQQQHARKQGKKQKFPATGPRKMGPVPQGKMTPHGKARSKDKTKGKGKGRQVLGILGLPVRNWDVGDCDYDDSEDDTYFPPTCESDLPSASAADGGGSGSRSGVPRNRTSTTRQGRNSQGKGDGDVSSCSGGADWVTRLSSEVILSGVIRPYLSSTAKCALQRTCRHMRKLLDEPRAWELLDLRAELVGTRTMRSGRQSILSNHPLFFMARSVIMQPRFSRAKSADLRGMNLGVMGSSPDLLLKLFEHCRHLRALNLWGAFLEDPRLVPPDCALERVIVEELPELEHLALDIDASNRGLRLLLERCRRLKSLHIGSRSNRRGDCVSMYPNDSGLKAFSLVGAPCLETLSLFDKTSIGAAGLRCLFDGSSCPQLKTLILTNLGRVTSQCLKTIAPEMSRVTRLVVDYCPIKPSAIQCVIERCPELRDLVVAGDRDVMLKNLQEGKPFLLEYLPVCTTKLESFKVEVRQWHDGPPRSSPGRQGPEWFKKHSRGWGLRYNAATCTASNTPAADRPRLVIGQSLSADDRIKPFMTAV